MALTQQVFGTKRIPVPFATESNTRSSVLQRFLQWCEGQQENRLLWLGIALAGHGCVLTPVTALALLLAGGGFVFIVIALASMGLALVSNLAAMPTKYTIPVFIFSVLIDLLLLALAFSMGFHPESAFQ